MAQSVSRPCLGLDQLFFGFSRMPTIELVTPLQCSIYRLASEFLGRSNNGRFEGLKRGKERKGYIICTVSPPLISSLPKFPHLINTRPVMPRFDFQLQATKFGVKLTSLSSRISVG